jgi:hypothetical protein
LVLLLDAPLTVLRGWQKLFFDVDVLLKLVTEWVVGFEGGIGTGVDANPGVLAAAVDVVQVQVRTAAMMC